MCNADKPPSQLIKAGGGGGAGSRGRGAVRGLWGAAPTFPSPRTGWGREAELPRPGHSCTASQLPCQRETSAAHVPDPCSLSPAPPTSCHGLSISPVFLSLVFGLCTSTVHCYNQVTLKRNLLSRPWPLFPSLNKTSVCSPQGLCTGWSPPPSAPAFPVPTRSPLAEAALGSVGAGDGAACSCPVGMSTPTQARPFWKVP